MSPGAPPPATGAVLTALIDTSSAMFSSRLVAAAAAAAAAAANDDDSLFLSFVLSLVADAALALVKAEPPRRAVPRRAEADRFSFLTSFPTPARLGIRLVRDSLSFQYWIKAKGRAD